LAAVLLCPLVLPALCLADQEKDRDPDFSLADTVQVGPFHMAPFFSVKDLGYDGNTRLGAGESTGDYTITFGPGARAVAPLGRLAAVSVWEQIDYSVFARQSDLNHVNNSLRSKVHVYLRDFTVYADGEQISSRDRPNNEIDYRIRTKATQGKLGFKWNPGTRGNADLFVRSTGFDYDPGRPDVPAGADPGTTEQAVRSGEAIAESLQRVETTAGMSGSLRFRPRTSALLDLRESRIDFDNDTDSAGNPRQRDSEAHSVMGGLEFDPAGSLRGYMKAGFKRLVPDDPGVEGYSGLIADASLSARLLGRGEVRAVYQRDTGFSTFGSNLFYLNDKKALSYEHYMNSRLSLELGRQLEDASYPAAVQLYATGSTKCPLVTSPGFGCSPQRRRDDIVTDRVTVRYRLGPALRIGLSVGRWERNSNFNTEDAERPTIATLLEYTP